MDWEVEGISGDVSVESSQCRYQKSHWEWHWPCTHPKTARRLCCTVSMLFRRENSATCSWVVAARVRQGLQSFPARTDRCRQSAQSAGRSVLPAPGRGSGHRARLFPAFCRKNDRLIEFEFSVLHDVKVRVELSACTIKLGVWFRSTTSRLSQFFSLTWRLVCDAALGFVGKTDDEEIRVRCKLLVFKNFGKLPTPGIADRS